MKKRVISAIVMLAIVIPLLIIGGLAFEIAVSIISVGCIYELMKAKEKEKKIPVVIKAFAYVFTGGLVFVSSYFNDLNAMLDYRMLSSLFLAFLIPVVIINDNEKYNINDALYMIGGIIFLLIALTSFTVVRDLSLSNFLYLILITIMTDTFALFSGKLIGKHKLCEKISPNKTIEGAVGGSIAGTIIATLFYMFVINNSANVFLVIIITLLLTIIGQIGDLLFSSIKRYYKIKDFSNLIPGHGGILDRIDSLIFVVLTYILLSTIL